MDLSNLGTKAKEIFAKVRSAFSAIPWRNQVSKLRSALDRFLHRFPEDKRKPILYGMGGLVALFFVLLILTLVLHSGKPGGNAASELASGHQIPPEDLFLPAEPDFVPKYLLEWEPRSFWTLDDIRPYWRSPEKSGIWRDEIRSVVDKLMDGVP